MIEKKNYPITVLEDISNLMKYFYSVEHNYLNDLEMHFDGTHLIYINSKNSSGYKFLVTTPSQGSDKKTYFNITRYPRNISTNDEHTFPSLAQDVKNHFDNWFLILQRYQSISISKDDFISSEEEKQFYDDFDIPEEGKSERLSIESQFKVYKLLEELQGRLESKIATNPDVKEIIEDAEDLKNNIRDLPQNIVAKRVAKIKVKIKKIGIKFFLDVVDVAYKEAIKIALRGGIDGIHQLL